MLSPKSPQELRQMFDEKFGAHKFEPKEEKRADEKRDYQFVSTAEPLALISPQRKAEKVCDEVISTLVSELSQEYSGDKKYIADKIMRISVESSQTNLHNFIENNHLFSPSSPSSGEKQHPNFQPNIHLPTPEEARHEHVIPHEKHHNHEDMQAQIQQGNMIK